MKVEGDRRWRGGKVRERMTEKKQEEKEEGKKGRGGGKERRG